MCVSFFRCCRFNVSFYLNSYLFYFSPAFDFWCGFLINFFSFCCSRVKRTNSREKKRTYVKRSASCWEFIWLFVDSKFFFVDVDVVAAAFFSSLSCIYFALVKFKNVISIFLCEIVFRCSVFGFFFLPLFSLSVPLRLCWIRLLGILSVSFVFPERFRPLCSSNSPKKKNKKNTQPISK